MAFTAVAQLDDQKMSCTQSPASSILNEEPNRGIDTLKCGASFSSSAQ